MSEPPTPDPDDRGDIAGDIARQVAAIRRHLPPDDLLNDPAWRTTERIVVYGDGNGRDVASIAVAGYDLLYTLTTTTDGREVVLVTRDDEQDVRHLIGAWRGGRPYRDANIADAVTARFDVLVGHLSAPLADEVRAAVDAGDVEWTPNLAADTHTGRLSFLTRARRRAYVLDHDRDGQQFAQVTWLEEDGTASSATFRGGELVAGQIARMVLEPPPPDADDPDEGVPQA
jgi:hypothetical protein